MDFYNSFSLYYKYPFGAVKEKTEITLRVYDETASFVNLIFVKDEEEPVYYPMKKISFYGDMSVGIIAPGLDYNEMPIPSGEWWQVTISPEIAGIYFYSFQTDNGEITNHTKKWQQTVYKADYKTPEWIKGGLYYQIFPDRFYKDKEPCKIAGRYFSNWEEHPCYIATETGKFPYVINNDYYGGTLSGINKKLSYLKSLGVGCIYLNPIFEAHSNHRYNTADYMKIDPTLGTINDFRDLCSAANNINIKIILDGVFSHTGSDSVYFNKEKRYGNGGAYNDKNSPFYEWYTFKNWPDEYNGWWGYKTLPETVELSEFKEFICGKQGVISYWMNLGAAGFRLDVADELPDKFICDIRTAVKRENPDGLLIGEVWEDASNKISYGARRAFLFGDELDGVMNYTFLIAVTAFIKSGNGDEFIENILNILEHYPQESVHVMMNLLGTHDTERIITALVGEECSGRDREWQSTVRLSAQERDCGEAMVRIASLIQYVVPGVPCLYYGDEIGMEGYRDPFNRGSFNWNLIDSDITNWYKFLGKLRADCPALRAGDFIPTQSGNGYISFIRKNGKNEIFIAINVSEVPVEIWLLKGWKDDKIILGDFPQNGILTLPPKSSAVIGRGEWVRKRDFYNNF